jgi:hypothetical protein
MKQRYTKFGASLPYRKSPEQRQGDIEPALVLPPTHRLHDAHPLLESRRHLKQ